MKLVFATKNLNKLKEVTNLIKNQIKVINLNDINCNEDILETENILLELVFYIFYSFY